MGSVFRSEAGMRAVAVILAWAMVFTPEASAQAAQTERESHGLKLVVLEGDGAINNIKEGRAREPVVQVLNAADQPVAGAVVSFVLPALGPTAVFSNGSSTLSIPTDQEGKAVARGLRPNNVVGQFEIRVTAVFEGSLARAVITQTNALPETGTKKTGTLILILALIGGGAAGAALGLSGKNGASAPPTPAQPATPPTTISVGTPGIGAP